MRDDDNEAGRTQGRAGGTGGYRHPSLPTLGAGDQIPTADIGDRLERRIRSLAAELDEARSLQGRYNKNSNDTVLAECRKFLDDRFRLHSELERIRIDTADNGKSLLLISRATHKIYEGLGLDKRVSMNRSDDPSSFDHVDPPARVQASAAATAPVPDADLLGSVVANAVAAAIGPAVENAVASAVSEALERIERMADVRTASSGASSPEAPSVPDAVGGVRAEGGGDPSPSEEDADQSLLPMDVTPEPKQRKTFGALAPRAKKHEVFGRAHPDFLVASELAVKFVRNSPVPLTAGAISDHLRKECGIGTFQVSPKNIGNRLLMMGLVRLKKKSGGTAGFWAPDKTRPEGWIV